MKTYCPYRICPLGAHIDHQYGVVSGGAIDLGITFTYEELDSPQIIISSTDYEGSVEFSINSPLNRSLDWADYFRGIILFLNKKYKLSKGVRGIFKGDLPSGGISSSSASQIAFLLAVCKVNKINLKHTEVIELVYLVERDYMGLSVGILDPSCEVLSKSNSLLFLDTLTNFYQVIENKDFNEEYQFVILYSGVERSLIHSQYNERVKDLEDAYHKLGIEITGCGKLRDIPKYYYEKKKHDLGSVQLKRSEHYFSEMERVGIGLKAWRENDMRSFGALMNASCESSINNYESGSEYLIHLYQITKDQEGVLGTRFLGAGFNGSSLALIKKEKYEMIKSAITRKYLKLYPKFKETFKIIPVVLSDGVHL